jgi:hypothetical protein
VAKAIDAPPVPSFPSPSHPKIETPNINTKSTKSIKSTKDEPKSISELQLKIYPTIPMQTQALADFCIACLEEALVIYTMERYTVFRLFYRWVVLLYL